ncbi:hypothetical protein Tco_1210323 [Tanacetum coccineum]
MLASSHYRNVSKQTTRRIQLQIPPVHLTGIQFDNEYSINILFKNPVLYDSVIDIDVLGEEMLDGLHEMAMAAFESQYIACVEDIEVAVPLAFSGLDQID